MVRKKWDKWVNSAIESRNGLSFNYFEMFFFEIFLINKKKTVKNSKTKKNYNKFSLCVIYMWRQAVAVTIISIFDLLWCEIVNLPHLIRFHSIAQLKTQICVRLPTEYQQQWTNISWALLRLRKWRKSTIHR